jgi:plastocyanin
MRLGFALAVACAAVMAGCGPTTTTPPSPSAALSPSPGEPVSAITIVAGGDADVYRYKPADLTVRATVPVTVRFVDGDVVDHTWTVFDRDGTTVLANLAVAREGDEATGTFTFARTGTYQFWCTIPGHKAFGEIGSLTVLP